METAIWTVLTIIASCCTGGFFFLNKRLNDLSDHIDMSKKFSEQLIQLSSDVHEIKNALIGTYQDRGLIGRVHDQEKKLEALFKELDFIKGGKD